MSAAQESVISLVEAAVAATLGGDSGRAENALKAIVVSRPSLDTASLADAQVPVTTTGAKSKRINVSLSTQIAVFRRDQFTCRYCGRQTLLTPLLRILSALYPSALPYHLHWKFDTCHKMYWTHTASLEHIKPVAAGGSNDPENLATACYWCNDWKNSWTVEQLCWTLNPPTATVWDGLSQYYPSLCEVYARRCDDEPETYFRKWLRALDCTRQGVSGAGR